MVYNFFLKLPLASLCIDTVREASPAQFIAVQVYSPSSSAVSPFMLNEHIPVVGLYVACRLKKQVDINRSI